MAGCRRVEIDVLYMPYVHFAVSSVCLLITCRVVQFESCLLLPVCCSHGKLHEKLVLQTQLKGQKSRLVGNWL